MLNAFSTCPACQRLLIAGQSCVCAPPPPVRKCDCTYSGNTQHLGPLCRARMRQVWADFFARASGR